MTNIHLGPNPELPNGTNHQNMEPDQIIGLVQESIRPDIERRLQARRDLDQQTIHGLRKLAAEGSQNKDTKR